MSDVTETMTNYVTVEGGPVGVRPQWRESSKWRTEGYSSVAKGTTDMSGGAERKSRHRAAGDSEQLKQVSGFPHPSPSLSLTLFSLASFPPFSLYPSSPSSYNFSSSPFTLPRSSFPAPATLRLCFWYVWNECRIEKLGKHLCKNSLRYWQHPHT